MITATIYTKPHLAHWLCHQYGSPVDLPRSCPFRATLLSCLGKDVIAPDGLIRIEVVVNKNIVSSFGHTIRQDRLGHFSKILTEDMDRHLYDFVNGCRAMTIDNAIAYYQERMGFEERDFAFDNIRRRYFRYKKRIFHASVTKRKAV